MFVNDSRGKQQQTPSFIGSQSGSRYYTIIIINNIISDGCNLMTDYENIYYYIPICTYIRVYGVRIENVRGRIYAPTYKHVD